MGIDLGNKFGRAIYHIAQHRDLKVLFAVLLFMMGQGTAYSSEKDTVVVVADTVKAEKMEKPAKKPKHECCEDTTVTDHKSAYHKLVKEGGSMREGLFTVRHIKDDWYLEVPDALVGRLMLAVTRFASVPQGFKLISGEEVNLPQTGNNDLLYLLLICSAVGLTGAGLFTVSRSGVMRRKEENA